MAFFATKELFSLENSIAGEYLGQFAWPWEALEGISAAICTLGKSLPAKRFIHPAEDIWIAKSARVAPTAFIGGPCIIDEEAEVRHCAFIRGSALVGKGAVVGNSTELKNAILFDGVQVPHFNYVGDSILGHKAHMGAGAITSNVKSDKSLVVIKAEDGIVETGRKKVGAMLGDNVEIGCNSVLNPGSILGPGSMVYPTSNVRGVVPPRSIFKGTGNIQKMRD